MAWTQSFAQERHINILVKPTAIQSTQQTTHEVIRQQASTTKGEHKGGSPLEQENGCDEAVKI